MHRCQTKVSAWIALRPFFKAISAFPIALSFTLKSKEDEIDILSSSVELNLILHSYFPLSKNFNLPPDTLTYLCFERVIFK